MITLNQKQKRHLFLLLFLNSLLLGIGVDLYVPSLPTIVSYFHTTQNLVQMTLGAYSLAFGLGSLLMAALLDSFSRRKVLLISYGLFIIASFSSLFASNVHSLIFFRAVQGFSCAGFGSCARSIPGDCFTGKDLAKAFTYIMISWGLGPIIGPVIGAYLQHFFNWQACFVFFGTYCLLLFLYTLKKLPETKLNLTPFQPLPIYQNMKHLFTSPFFLGCGMLGGLTFTIMIVFSLLGPFLIQTTLKYSVIAYGQISLLLGFGYFLGGLCNRFLISYFQPARLIFLGVISGLAVSLIMLILALTVPINLPIILAPALLILFFCAFIFPNLLAKTIGSFAKISGTANGLLGIFLAVIGFSFTALAKFIPTTTQIPMALSFVSLFALALFLYLLLFRENKAEN